MIEMDVVAEDLWFPEGPIAMADGSVLLVRHCTILPHAR